MPDNTLRMHWAIPLKRDWPAWAVASGAVPVTERATGAMVCAVSHRRSAPYTLATARAIVRANNDAVNAARKQNDPQKAR